MSHVEPPNIGNIIPSALARKIIYGIYATAALAVGAISAYFLGTSQPLPVEILGAQQVIAYLAIPIGGLAVFNTPAVSELPADIQARFDAVDEYRDSL